MTALLCFSAFCMGAVLGWAYGYDAGFIDGATRPRPRVRLVHAKRVLCGEELWIAAPSHAIAADILIADVGSRAPTDRGSR